MRPLYFIKIVATFDMVLGFQKRNKYKKANHTGGIGLYIEFGDSKFIFFPTLFNKKKINIDFEVFISSILVLIILNCYLNFSHIMANLGLVLVNFHSFCASFK